MFGSIDHESTRGS